MASQIKVGMKFERKGVANRDGSPIICTILRINRWGAIFYSVRTSTSHTKSNDFYFVPGGEGKVVGRWVGA
jgi:hypothetical protein